MFAWFCRLFTDPHRTSEPLPPPAQAAPWYPPEPISPPVANTVVRVESRDPCFPFEVHLVVRHGTRNATSVVNPLLIAQAGIDRRAREVAAKFSLTEGARLQADLEVALSQRIEVERTGVVAWASCLAVDTN